MPIKSPLAWPNGKAYLFQGTDYVRYDFQSGALDQAALPIAPTNWSGLRATAPDAAVYWGFGKVYFFYGDEYVRFDLGLNGVEPEYLPPNRPTNIITFDRVDLDYPKSIAGNWNGVWPADLDGVLYQGGTKAYFFKDNDYRRYDLESDRVDESESIGTFVLNLVPLGMWTAARDLTLDVANSVMGYLIENGKFTLRATQTPYTGSWKTGITRLVCQRGL